MDARYLLDTNICIYIRQRRPDQVLKRFQRLQPGEAVLSVITFGELQYGAAKSRQSGTAFQQLQELASLLPRVPLPENAGEFYGRVRFELESKGRLIGNNDLWIAAHALALNLVLVTNNVEFSRIRELEIENWTQ
jgi:tRNA(fMet)-specific endonuclease VapC